MNLPLRALLAAAAIAVPCVTEAGITVWRDKEKRGDSMRIERAYPDLRESGFDDSISSLETDAAEEWLVCSEPRFRGECRTVSGVVENFHGSGMNDRITSVRPARGQSRGWLRRGQADDDARGARTQRRDDDVDPDEPRRTRARDTRGPREAAGARAGAPAGVGAARGVLLFDEPSFSGNARALDGAIPDLSRLGWNDRARSLEVRSGSWLVCADDGFRGRCVTVARSVPNLSALGLEGQVSSVRPATDGDPDPWWGEDWGGQPPGGYRR
jgi:hypothetical protein